MRLNKPFFSSLLCIALGLGAVRLVNAEDIIVPIARQGAYLGDIKLPTLGLTQQEVITRYGLPQQKTATVGEPPISRWDYADFSVYFENDKVLHSVLKHRRQDTADGH